MYYLTMVGLFITFWNGTIAFVAIIRVFKFKELYIDFLYLCAAEMELSDIYIVMNSFCKQWTIKYIERRGAEVQ